MNLRFWHRRPRVPKPPSSSRRGTHEVLELGKQFPSPVELEARAVESGRQAGLDELAGKPHGQKLTEHNGRRKLASEVDARIIGVRRRSKVTQRDLESQIETTKVVLRPEKLQEKVASDDVKDYSRKWNRIEKGLGVSTVFYLSILALLAIAEFPSISGAVQTWPFDANTRLLIAIVLSIVFAAAAHVVSAYIHRTLVEVQKKNRSTVVLVRGIALSVVLILAIALLMAYLALSRDVSFATVAEVTGNTFSEPDLAAGALFAVQLLLFIIALAVGLQHAEGDEERRIKRHLKKVRRQLERKQEDVVYVESALRQFEEELQALPSETTYWIQQEQLRKESLLESYGFEFNRHRLSPDGDSPIAPSPREEVPGQ